MTNTPYADLKRLRKITAATLVLILIMWILNVYALIDSYTNPPCSCPVEEQP